MLLLANRSGVDPQGFEQATLRASLARSEPQLRALGQLTPSELRSRGLSPRSEAGYFEPRLGQALGSGQVFSKSGAAFLRSLRRKVAKAAEAFSRRRP
jgi:hypothetical protein